MAQELRKGVVRRLTAWSNKPSQPSDMDGGVRLIRLVVRLLLSSLSTNASEQPMPTEHDSFAQLKTELGLTDQQLHELTPEQLERHLALKRALDAMHLNDLLALVDIDTHNKKVNELVAKIEGRSADDQQMIENLATLDKAKYAQRTEALKDQINDQIFQEAVAPPPREPPRDVTPKRHPMALDVPANSVAIKRVIQLVLSVGSIIGCVYLWILTSPSGGINWAAPFCFAPFVLLALYIAAKLEE